MNQREVELHIQRGQLRERIRAQRAELALNVAPIRQGLDRLDYTRAQLRDAKQWLGKNPAVLTAAAVALATWKPRLIFRTLRKGYGLWRNWKKLQGFIARFSK